MKTNTYRLDGFGLQCERELVELNTQRRNGPVEAVGAESVNHCKVNQTNVGGSGCARECEVEGQFKLQKHT